MRHLYAILILVIFLFYHAGYYLIYVTARYQVESLWENKIASDNLEGEHLQLSSINISLPYQADQEKFVNVSGKIEIEGQTYRVVKQRYAQDTLHVVYIYDAKSETLKSSFKNWISSLHNKPLQKSGIIIVNFIKNFLPGFFSFDLHNILASTAKHGFTLFQKYQSPYIYLSSPPPEG